MKKKKQSHYQKRKDIQKIKAMLKIDNVLMKHGTKKPRDLPVFLRIKMYKDIMGLPQVPLDQKAAWAFVDSLPAIKKEIKPRPRKQPKVEFKKNPVCLVSERIYKSAGLIKERKKVAPSISEKKIIDWLKNNSVDFVSEWHHIDCYSDLTNHVLFFDFYLPEFDAIIEFDGVQHFKGEAIDLAKRQRYDNIKNRFCSDKGVPLLRIHY